MSARSLSCVLVAVVTVALFVLSAFSIMGVRAESGDPLALTNDIENPVTVAKLPGKSAASVVQRTWISPWDFTWHHWVENSGLKSMSISIGDATSGSLQLIASYNIVFSEYGAYPTGTVALPDVSVIKDHVYVLTLAPVGKVKTSALYFHDCEGFAPPVASITYQMNGYSVQVDGSSSYDLDGTIVSYVWVWGDGFASAGVTSSHWYTVSGPGPGRSVILTVTDDDGLVDSLTMNLPPSPPYYVAGYTYGPDGVTALQDCAVVVADLNTGVSYSIASDSIYGYYMQDICSNPGGWSPGDVIRVTATKGAMIGSNEGVAIDGVPYIQVDVTLFDPPVASFEMWCAQDFVSVDASASYDPDGTIVSYVWDWGDGTTGAGVVASHEYASTFNMVVTLTVIDDNGATDSESKVAFPEPPFMIAGYTFGPDGATLLPDCTVVVLNLRTGYSFTTTSDSEYGFYIEDLNRLIMGWQDGDVIHVTATKGTLSGWSEGVASWDLGAFLQIDIVLTSATP